MPGEPPPGDPRVPRVQGPDPEPADTAPSAAAANSGSPPPQQLSREGPDPRDVAKRTVDRMKSEYMRVLNEIPGNPGGRLRVNAKTGSSVPVTPMTTEASRSIEWAILAAVLTVAEEEVLAAAREGRISFNDEDVERELAEPPEDQGREKVPIFVTKNITKAQSLKAPFDSYDWMQAFVEECEKVFGEFEVLCPPVPEWKIPRLDSKGRKTTRATLLAVRAIKYFDLARALHQARIRVVYGGHRIWDSEGNTVDKKNHDRDNVARLGATSPFEVRVSLAWAMIAPSDDFELAVPIIVSFDVTSAYLQASLNDQEYYVCIEDEMLLEALKKVTGWKWDFKGKAWFRMNKALYGHPLAGDFWAGTFKRMVLDIGYSPIESDDEKTVYVYYKNERIVAVLVIYVDDGFLVTFDTEVAKKTEDLLRTQWQVREWNRWQGEEAKRFLAGDHYYLSDCSKVVENMSKVLVDMSSYKKLGIKSFLEDGGVCTTATPKTPMTTEEEPDGQAWRKSKGDGARRADPADDAELSETANVVLVALMAELNAGQRKRLTN